MASLKTCVVCGMQSHRSDWILKSGNFVACDNHSKDELALAVKKAMAPAPPPPAVTKAPVGKPAAAPAGKPPATDPADPPAPQVDTKANAAS